MAIAQEDGNRYVESLALTNLGLAYNALGEYHRAIEFYQKSLEIQRTIGDRKGEANSLGNLGKSYYFLRQYQQAIDFYQQSLEIQRAIGDRRKEADILQILAYAYNQCGRVQEVFAASYQAQLIRQELELPLEAMPYPKWIKSLIKYAQRGKFQLFLCFLFGFIAFPFALVWIIVRILWLLTKRLLRR